MGAICAEVSRRRPTGRPALLPTPAQLACYPGGGEKFWAHRDSAPFNSWGGGEPSGAQKLISARQVSAVLYLQDTPWEDQWGGALRAHCDRAYPGGPVDVLPDGGSLVLFRSRDLEHEVLPTHHLRYALTMWYLADVADTRELVGS